MNDKMNELQAYALRDMVQGLLKMKTVTTVEIFGKAAEPAVQAIQESLDASVPALVDTLGWALHELSLLKRRVESAESTLDTATEALAWYADGTNYVAQVDARGHKQRPIMVLKAHRAEVALRKIGRWPVRA